MYWGGPQVDTQVPPLCSPDKITMHVVHTETRLVRTLGPQNCREDLQLEALPAYSPSRGCQGLNPKYPYQLFTNTFSVSIRALGLCSQLSWWLASVGPSAGQFVSTLSGLGLTLFPESLVGSTFLLQLPCCSLFSCSCSAWTQARGKERVVPGGSLAGFVRDSWHTTLLCAQIQTDRSRLPWTVAGRLGHGYPVHCHVRLADRVHC